MDETYLRVKGEWMYLYRAVDREGNTIDFLLTHRRNKLATHKFLLKAIRNNGCPKVINIDKSGANKEAIKTYKRWFKKIRIRQCKYLNNRVQQDHRFIKWRIQNMLGFNPHCSLFSLELLKKAVKVVKSGVILQFNFP